MPVKKRTATGVLGGLAGLVGLSAVAGVLITATVTPAIAVSGAAASSAITMFDQLPSALEIDQLMLPTTLYYKNPDTGEDIVLTKFWDQNRIPVSFEEVPTVMYDAILSSEDPRYYEHGGVDLIGTTRAVLTNIRGGSETQGGSSISQQYVKNVLIQRCEADAETEEAKAACFYEATQSSGTEGIQRKLQEMRYAIQLEKEYSKNEILLGYLDIANFGGTNYGIGAAAQYYFGVPASQLSLTQAATLAGMVQNPNSYRIDQPTNEVNGAADGYSKAKGRQTYVLGRMLEDGKITQEQHDAAVAEPITPNIVQPQTGCAAALGSAYFCQYVKTIIQSDPAFGATDKDREEALKRGGLNVYTSLDVRLQLPAEQAMRDWAPGRIDGMSFGAASVNVEATTGRVLSMAQNTTFTEDLALSATDPAYSSLVYASDKAHGGSQGFPVGSTYKLFTLIDWLEKGHSLNETLNGVNRVFPRMKANCQGDWVNTTRTKIDNFAKDGGYTGTVSQFTKASLNSGFLAMAEKLDLCDINKVADRMGVKTGDGQLTYQSNPDVGYIANVAFDVLGSKNISPLAMAGAYATVANKGIYCTPKAIDRVTDANGQEIAPPVSTCTQVIAPEVAATAAYALQGVMNSGGTGAASNPRDGTPLIGKTGTHNTYQTMMIESSTNATTAVWVGNVKDEATLYKRYYNGVELAQLRHRIAPVIQRAANAVYGGDEFPRPDNNLTRQVLTNLPSTVGMPVDQARATLQEAGFTVLVGEAVDSGEAEGIIARQDPAGGRIAGGATVTINPSNGQGISVPDVSGQRPEQALSAIRGAGFGNAAPGTCTEDANADKAGVVTSTNPAAGSVTNRNAQISVNYSRDKCP
ncbi:transglycosylase domain-containing protein [Microbacterium sp. DT81.1]|uniref:transglycosylase domain-containing protein n=1 Tax=Microbacterium sp. DT81.1 TaxID=3393413 RepID=UPI003CF8EE01